jgi:hypothetical protein
MVGGWNKDIPTATTFHRATIVYVDAMDFRCVLEGG